MSTAALAPTTITLKMSGTLSTSLVEKVALPFAGKITSAMAVVSTAPVGSALNFTLVKGAVNAGAFSIASGAETDAATLTDANCSFAAGDIIALTVSQIGSTTAGANLTVAFTVVES